MAWTDNAQIFFWDKNKTPSPALVKVTDHNRAPLTISYERFEKRTRMADSTLRRYSIAKKKSWSTSWENLPSTNSKATGLKTVDGGLAGEDIETFYNLNDDAFRMVLRRGSAVLLTTPTPADSALPYEDGDFYICKVMITDFNKEVTGRGIIDFWTLGITLEEV